MILAQVVSESKLMSLNAKYIFVSLRKGISLVGYHYTFVKPPKTSPPLELEFCIKFSIVLLFNFIYLQLTAYTRSVKTKRVPGWSPPT